MFSLTATAGQPAVTTTRYLTAGAYTVRYTRTAGTVLLNYDLFMLKLSDGVGPYATTTGSSGGTGDSGGGSNNYTYTGNSTTKPNGYGYVF